MTVRKFSDQGFDDFRKERQRARAKAGPAPSVLGYENQALRELEQVEANEIRDRQLTREVHDFFAAATKQAASIVDRVSRDAQQETGARVEQEMEAFLIDSLSRMNNFVLAVLQTRRGSIAEAQMTPSVGNLAGGKLDEFRWAGTAEVGDKHIGQDPFATTVDEVQREFRLTTEGSPNDLAVPIDQHLVAGLGKPSAPAANDEDDERTAALVAAATVPAPALPPQPAPITRSTAAGGLGAPAALAPAAVAHTMAHAAVAHPTVAHTTVAHAAVAAPAAEAAPVLSQTEELERFKGALKALVRQNVMTREEAKAAWDTRLQSIARKS